jgi:glucosamine kinase
LARAVWRVAGADPQALLAWSVGAGQTRYAELAPLVFETAPEDPMAERLLAHATRALEAMARALDPAGVLPLALMGSVGRRLAPRLAPELRERCVAPQGDATEGALHLIRKHLGRA